MYFRDYKVNLEVKVTHDPENKRIKFKAKAEEGMMPVWRLPPDENSRLHELLVDMRNEFESIVNWQLDGLVTEISDLPSLSGKTS